MLAFDTLMERSSTGGRAARVLLVCTMLATFMAVAPHAVADSSVGSFEIDGNLVDDSGPGEPVDWESPEIANQVQTFDDTVGKGDDIFGGGSSKNSEPGSWNCTTGQVPNKNDLVRGQLFFRTFEGKQYLALNYIRNSHTGDANVDIELNQSRQPNPSCPELPIRTDGDIIIAFDTENGGKVINVRAFTWRFTGPGIGEFDELPLGAGIWNAAVNIPNTINGLRPGQFGEAIINLSDSPIGDIECGQFGATHIKTRSSTSINSELKDRTQPQPFQGPCPDSRLAKAVRNVTQGGSFNTTATAEPGDLIEYQLTYDNLGAVPATNVTISDQIRPRTSFVSCSDECTVSNSTISWHFDSVEAGGTQVVTFRVKLDDSFPAGTTTITNVATVDTDQEEPRTSNETTVTVDAGPEFEVEKNADDTVVEVGGTTTYRITVRNVGNADGTVTVVDDYDQNHVTVDEISNGGVDNDALGTITWTNVFVAAGGERELTYEATFSGPFSTGAGTGGCGEDQFPVINTVTVNGQTDTETVCVIAEPRFTVTKTADDKSVAIGESTTYEIVVRNVGDASGSTTVTDDYDADHVTVSNIDPAPVSHDTTNGVITWETGVLQPSQSETFTYTATFTGPFEGPSGEDPCAPGRFPVVNTVTVTGDDDTEVVCVIAEPEFLVSKSASQTSAQVGDTITYEITVTNAGDAPGTTDVVDDYDEDHVVVGNITGGGIDEGGEITWSDVTLDPGQSVTFTYEATFVGPFEGPSGEDPCDPGEFPVINTVTVEGDDDTEIVCVEARPDPSLVKSSDAEDRVTAGDTVTYTLTYRNDGDADARDVRIREDIPESTTFTSCSDDCIPTGDPVNRVRWDIGTVEPGGVVTVTLTVTVTDDVGCVICNVARASSPDHTDEFSNEVCLEATPAPDPSGANANDSAFGAHVLVTLLGQQVTDQTLVPVESEQSGIGSDADSDELFGLDVPGVLSASVLRTSSTSTVSEQPAQARHTSIAEAADVNILNGLVTASLVRGVAETTATGDASSFSSIGSTFKELVVNGVAMNDVTPDTRVDLPAALFGAGSYVALYERAGSTSRPDPGQLIGGTYAADLSVNMIRVHVTALAPLGDQVDVIVSNAVAHSDFPQTELCETAPLQAVSGHAFIASAVTDPSLLPILAGFVSIPTTGGHDHQNVQQASLPQDGSLVTTGVAVTDSMGVLASDSSTASSSAEVAAVCLLPMDGACTVGANVVNAASSSTATEAGAGSAGESVLAGVTIAGTPIEIGAEPNQVFEIPGIGFVIFNEQVCDNGASLAAGCSDGMGHAGLTVRAIRLVVTVPIGIEIIVSEAHSDATFVPAPAGGGGGDGGNGGGGGGNGGGGGGNGGGRKK